jgi:hypothetical protein
MTATLLENITSVLKGRTIYGRKDDQVTILFESDSMCIVEGTHWLEVETKGVKAKGTEFIKSGFHRYPVHKTKMKCQ